MILLFLFMMMAYQLAFAVMYCYQCESAADCGTQCFNGVKMSECWIYWDCDSEYLCTVDPEEYCLYYGGP